MTTRGRRKKRRQRKIIAVCAVAAVLLAVITAVLIALVYKSGFGKDKGGSFYKEKDSRVKNEWVEADGNRYYAGEDSYFLTGLNEIDGSLYFFDGDGRLETGFITDNSGNTMYAGQDGKIAVGEQEIDGASYMFSENGVMLTGWQTVSGKKYFFGNDGKKVSYGMVTDDKGNTYYCLEDGGYLTGEQTIAGIVYHFDENGVLSKGLITGSDGTCYYIRDDGTVATGWITFENGDKGYASADGKVFKSAVTEIDGSLYYFDGEGKLGNGWAEWDGNKGYAQEGILAVGRQGIDGKTYFFDDDGKMLTGWIKYSDGKESYAEADGALVTGEKSVGGFTCKFDEDGYLISKSSDVPSGEKLVALTFDDGPSKYTPIILDAMEKTNSHCTFFVVGNRVNSYKETVKRADKLGCEIGSHTYEHATLTKLTPDGIKEQINKTNADVSAIIGKNCPVLRPPGGSVDENVCKNVNVPLILWNVDTRDWATRDTQKTIEGATQKIKDGDIILMHDLYESTANAVDDIILSLQGQGFKCVTVSELAAARGGASGGQKYFSFR